MSIWYDSLNIPYDSLLYRYDGQQVVADWMAEYEGIVIGGDGPYSIVSIQGLGDQPDTATSDRDQLRRDGLFAGDDFLKARRFVLTLDVSPTDYVSFDDALEALHRAFRPGQSERGFVFQIPGIAGGNKALSFVRPRKRSTTIDPSYFFGAATVAIELVSTDPRLYTADIANTSTGLPADDGGITVPLVFPLVIASGGSGGIVTADNGGIYNTPVVFRIDGPVTNPRIQNLTTSQTLEFDIELSAGEFLIIDSRSRSILLNGTASRYNTLSASSAWFDLEPGENEISFRADASDEGVLNISYRSAWV